MAGRICQPSAAQWSDRVEMPGEYSITFEDLYQAFKARLMRELVAEKDVSGFAPKGTCVEQYTLAEKP